MTHLNQLIAAEHRDDLARLAQSSKHVSLAREGARRPPRLRWPRRRRSAR
jgi:hypothetical protein